MGKRILITGAAGFIGSTLAEKLLKSGSLVLGLDNFDPLYDRKVKEANIAVAMNNKDFEFREGDIRDSDFIKECFSDFLPDVVVHLAAKAGVRPSLVDPKSYIAVNVLGTLNILEMMKESKSGKMIFASSSSVYGNNRKVPFSETDNVDFPISPYAASKKAGELLCHTFHHLYNLDISCLRFFTVYGPRQRPDLAINKFINAILKDEVIYLYGDGSTSRDYTYIDDIVNGIQSAIEKVKGFEIYNLGNAHPISLLSLLKLLENSAGRNPRIEYLPMQEGDVVLTFADISKARNELGYDPAVDIETGIMKQMRWIEEKYPGN